MKSCDIDEFEETERLEKALSKGRVYRTTATFLMFLVYVSRFHYFNVFAKISEHMTLSLLMLIYVDEPVSSVIWDI